MLTSAPRQTVVAPTDDQLMRQIGAHNAAAEAALATIYDRYAAAVHGLGLRMLGDPALAEHVVQETFWRLWRAAGSYQPGRVRLATWLLQIARNLAIGELRAASRRPVTAWRRGHALPPTEAWGTAAAAAPAYNPPDPATDVAELAQVQGVALSTVKTRLALALRKLARHLSVQQVVAEAQAQFAS
jgi:DNA-directed RNA polymerase specialized sigma24 family protein